MPERAMAVEVRRAIESVAHALDLSAHALVSRPEELPAQLAARLVGLSDDAIAAILHAVATLTDWPWLCSVRDAMTPPGGPELRTLVGHTGDVTCVVVTPDGARAVSGSVDRTVRVWDLTGRRPPIVLEGHANRVSCVALTPDGRRAVSASWDRTLRVWDLAGRAAPIVLEGHAGMIHHVAVTPDGRRAVSASSDKSLRVWNLAARDAPIVLEGHAGPVNHVVLTPDGKRAVSASEDRTLRIWDLENPRQQLVLEGHTDNVTHVALTPNGGQAVSASWDGTVRVWDTDTGACLTLQGHRSWVVQVAVTPDGQRVVSASHDRTIRIWDLRGRAAPIVLNGHREPVNCVQTLDESHLASVSADGTLRVWDLAGGAEPLVYSGHAGPVCSLAIAPNGSRVLTGSRDRDFTIRVWDLSRQPIRRSRHWQMGPASVTVSADGERAISCAWNGTPMYLWNLATSAEPEALEGTTGLGKPVAISADGLHAAWIGSAGNSLRYVDLSAAGESAVFGGIADEWTRLVLAGDGMTVVAATSSGEVRCWEVRSGLPCSTIVGRHENGGVFHLAASADGKRVVSVSSDSEGSVRFWDLTERRPHCELRGNTDRVTALALSSDGHRAVTLSWDGKLTIWDSVGGHAITLSAHSLAQRSLAVNGDATIAVSGSVDASVRVWDLVRQTEPVVLKAHTAEVTHTALTLDERYAVSTSLDGTLRVWHLGRSGRGATHVACFTNDAATNFSAPHLRPTSIVVADALGRLHVLRWRVGARARRIRAPESPANSRVPGPA